MDKTIEVNRSEQQLQQNPDAQYMCQACGADVIISAKEQTVRCRTCGHRIIFKKRVRMLMTYSAR